MCRPVGLGEGVHFVVEEIGGAEERLGSLFEYAGHVLIDASTIGLAIDPPPILSECW